MILLKNKLFTNPIKFKATKKRIGVLFNFLGRDEESYAMIIK